jgi:hypothetical protein
MVTWLYTRAVLRQRTLLPGATGLYPYLPAWLKNWTLFRAFADTRPRIHRPVDPPEARADRRYLIEPPLPPEGRPPCDPAAAAAVLDHLRRSLAEYDAALAVDPVGLLPPDLDQSALSPERFVLLLTGSAPDDGDGLGLSTDAADRERALWCRLAGRVVFGSEADRFDAVRRYGIPVERTQVVPGSLLTGGVIPADPAEVTAARQRRGLPDRFLLGVDSPHVRDNTLLLFQAVQILRWRGYPVPPLVLTAPEQRPLPERPSTVYRQELERARAAAGLVEGKDLFLLPAPEGPSRGVLEGAAAVSVVTDRSTAHAARQVCRAALQRCPVIACDNPYVRERWGPSGEFVLLPSPNDPVGLADALVYTLEHAEETAGRVSRAYEQACAEVGAWPSLRVEEWLREVAAAAQGQAGTSATADPSRRAG